MTTRPFTQDAALTAIAVNFMNPDIALIADDVLPRVDVGDETYKYDVYPSEEVFTVPNTTVGRRGMVPEVEFSAKQQTGAVVDRGLDSPIPQSDIDRAQRQRAQGNSNYDPEARAIEGLTHLVKLDRETRAVAVVENPDNYDADKKVALAGGDKWTDPNSDPIKDIQAAMSGTFIARPNIGATSRQVFDVLSTNPKILKAINRNDGDSGIATAQQIASIFGLQNIFIGDGFVNTARRGQPAQMGRLWGNAFSLMHRSSIAGTQNGIPTFGITAELRVNGSAMVAGRWFNPKGPGLLGGVSVRVGEMVEEHLVAPSVGYLIDTPI
ncbi:MAG: hypothetical protein AAF415_12905 [Pseudomonadota bacterium]